MTIVTGASVVGQEKGHKYDFSINLFRGGSTLSRWVRFYKP